jgi:hypothetical protein
MSPLISLTVDIEELLQQWTLRSCFATSAQGIAYALPDLSIAPMGFVYYGAPHNEKPHVLWRCAAVACRGSSAAVQMCLQEFTSRRPTFLSLFARIVFQYDPF